MNERVERFVYDDGIVRMFLLVTVLWGLVGMLVGLVIALQLVLPVLNFQTSWLSFGRLRPLHTNAVIFASRATRSSPASTTRPRASSRRACGATR
jgi:cbb3-type cytochrome oxidase subunit 1